MPSNDACGFYQLFLSTLKSHYQESKVFDGIFGAMMTVSIENNGPVTIVLDSKSKKAE